MSSLTRNRKALFTSSISVIHQIVAIVCGFILPRFFLSNYGSSVNGLVSSITQFLGFISLAECGVGAVVRAAFYKPLADKDNTELSRIVVSSERFFKKIALILLLYTIGLMLLYPMLVSNTFDSFYTASLIAVISISSFAQYYFGMTYRLLLASDQRGYICLLIQTVSIILNTVICVGLMNLGVGVHVVKFVSSLIFMMQPLILSYIGRHQYSINRKIKLEGEPIKQKWNGLAQHIAAVILNNTDTVVLTVFSSLENVSIYSIYFLVVNGVRQLVDSLTNGIQALFGNMLANDEITKLNTYFNWFEWFMHTVTVLTFGLTGVLIVPFVAVYTKGIQDVDYVLPLFGCLMALAQGCYCLRLPYSILILSAGHFKQTQKSAIIEAIINLVISIVSVKHLGLIGVALGTFVAMLYRTIYFAYYLSFNILNRNIGFFVKHCIVDCLSLVVIVSISGLLQVTVATYTEWFLLALKCGIMALLIVLAINFVFYKNEMNMSFGFLKK